MALYHVFVYGSLLSGLHNHCILGQSRKLGDGIISRFHDLVMVDLTDGCYPHVMHAKWINARATLIIGEIYEVDDKTLKDLDQLEGVPYHYGREQFMAKVIVNGIQIIQDNVFVYVANKDMAAPDLIKRQVVHGDWKRHLEWKDNQEFSMSETDMLTIDLDD